MNSHFFLILLRRLRRNKMSTFLNIAGLSVGIAVSLVIFMIIRNELSVDRFHQNLDRIYRVVSTETYRDGKMEFDGDVPVPLGDALRQEFQQAEKVASMWKIDFEEFQRADDQNEKFRISDVYFAEPTLFEIFDFPWLSGEPHTALEQPHTMALSRTMASAWYGNWEEAVGKTILVGLDKVPYKVTGIMEDVPSNTDLQLKIVLSYSTFRDNNKELFTNPLNWDNFNTSSQCFFLLGKNQQISSMNNLLHGFVAKHYTPLAAGSNTSDSSFFQPLKSMHFDSRFYRFTTTGLSYTELWTIGFIGIFIILMACVNFINLSTAQSLNRGKEIGIKKVLGSSPGKLFSEFITETAIVVLMALLSGAGIALLGWKSILMILEKNIPLDSFYSFGAVLFLLITGVIVSILAGFYPALIVSRFRPILALKSKGPSTSTGQILLRRGLITFQFVIAQMLIIGTLIVTSQMNFFRQRPMGFDRNSIVLVHLPYTVDGVTRNEMFRDQVLKSNGVIDASLCSEPPSSQNSGSTYFTFEGHTHPENLKIAYRFADSSYLSTFHLSLEAGRYPYPSDTIHEVLLNETTVKKLGFASADAVVGKRILWSAEEPIEIVGVVKDFHEASLKSEILPLALFTARRNYRTLAVKINPASLGATLSIIEKLFENRYPDKFFEAPFFDERIAAYYNSEAVALTLFRIFAALGIFISCLGLYGLVSFMTYQKNKEVGIRKVLGASAQSIVFLFSSEFTALIGLSFVIAAPISYYFMNQWVHSFYYHIDISWGIFVLALVMSIVIAWITVSYKAIKAAVANPVSSLRSE